MKLRVLGTSAALAAPHRSHVAFLLWADRPLLIECGPTVPWQFLRLGLDHRLVREVFVSHVHGDHSLGLPMLFTFGEIAGREWPLRVYCPSSAIEPLKTICRSCYPSQAALVEQRVEWVGLDETSTSRRDLGGGLALASAPGIHGVPELAYRFDFAGRSLVYSGDTAPAPAVRALAAGASLLLHEANWSERIDGRTSPDHTSARQAGRLAAEAGVERLGLVHISGQYAGREAELIAEAAEAFHGPIFIPRDGDELEV